MKKLMSTGILLIFFSCVVWTAMGQRYREGVKYYKCGIPSMAKAMLQDELKKGGDTQAETCYYLGELFFSEKQKDSADYYYKKGLEADPLYVFNKIGEGKVLLSSDPVAAEKLFSEVMSGKNKKNSDIVLAIAKAYAAYGADKAGEYLEKAKDIDSHNPDIYVFLGDRMAAAQKNGDACSQYEQAVHFDPSCTDAYVKFARIYANTNPQVGLDMLQKLEVSDPESVIAAREMAELYYMSSRYKEAAEAYEKCIVSPYCTDKERSRFATILFYYGNQARSLKLADEVLKNEPKSVVMQRIRMYDLIELKDYSRAMETARTFFSSTPADAFIGQDYMHYGRLLVAEKDFAQATEQYKKALALDPTRVELYKELASASEKLNQYDSAAIYYDRFIEKGEKLVTVADYFMLGKCHYFAGNAADSTEAGIAARKIHMQAADSVFAYVAEKAPDSYLGNFWRARANSALDPETVEGLAKPYYEAAATILEQDAKKNLRMLVECYSYLGYYHYLKNEIPQSKEYWNKILTLDPQNDVAQKALAGLK